MAVVTAALTAGSATAQSAVSEYSIDQQPVADALRDFSEQSGIHVVYVSKIAEAVVARGVNGVHSADEALSILLGGTDLEFEVIDDGTITIRRATSPREQSLIGPRPKKGVQLVQAGGARSGGGEAVVIEEDAEGLLEEIIVTSRKRAERLQDVPISISTFSAADLEAKSLTSLKELGQFTPNFSFFNHSSRGRSAGMLFIRGVGQTDPRIFWDPGVGLYVDGVFMGRMNGIDIDLMALERVEILRGPQGTLFGKNTIGGAVNVVTAKPTDEFSGTAEITTGRYSRVDGKASINVPIVPGKLAAKFAGATRNRDGYGTRLDFFTGEKVDEEGDEDSLSGRAIFNWTPSENVDVLFSIDATRVREKAGAGKTIAINDSPTLVGFLNGFVDPRP